MTNIIDSLHEDHANLAKLRDALERQLARFATLRRDILHSAQDAP